MVSKRNARDITPTSSSTTTTIPPTSPVSRTTSKSNAKKSPQDIALDIWQNYRETTPQRMKLIDTFMAFLVLVGMLQFVYCILVGNFPFNAFLSGFGATVGQFVLTASLRIQTNVENRKEFGAVSPERAFADYVLSSLILHFFCVNFIN
ncbi:DAD family-domain-containing protein [Calycina marina]|uniref:Dolichyl-diphosphooligosaccharide--protein glycosyltransferase subunit OST2 n=1 Tax=Calycina marina TaxID=1763456 RepID=A0A9P7ZBS1_9HELO|nr:DAD family-domain-containing protein [Calycina marina]